jgi:predicted O-methyltransferase YrrM
VVDAVIESYDFSGIDLLVDVGGGEGALLAAILAAYPALRGILFDQPHVVADARAVFERAGVAARCEVVEGSFFDTVPAGADAYLLKSIIHDWDDTAAVRILRARRTAIAAAGKLLLVERVIQPGNDPDPTKYMDLNMLVMLGGRERTADDFEALYNRAGFQLTRIVATPSGFSVIEGTPI